jgi:hypothetical protein
MTSIIPTLSHLAHHTIHAQLIETVEGGASGVMTSAVSAIIQQSEPTPSQPILATPAGTSSTTQTPMQQSKRGSLQNGPDSK